MKFGMKLESGLGNNQVDFEKKKNAQNPPKKDENHEKSL